MAKGDDALPITDVEGIPLDGYARQLFGALPQLSSGLHVVGSVVGFDPYRVTDNFEGP